jgi:isochorismate hydrolase
MPGIPDIESYLMPSTHEFPENIAKWQIVPNRAVLLVHDMQQFFLRKFPVPNPKDILLSNTVTLRKWCISYNIPVAYTCQSGNMTKQQRGLLKSFWGSGMKAEFADRQIIDDLRPTSKDWIFNKWRYSAFYNSDLLQRIKNAKRSQLIICGVYAHIGVLATAIESFSHDIETFVVGDAVADFSRTHHMMALNYAARCCAVVTSTQEIIR